MLWFRGECRLWTKLSKSCLMTSLISSPQNAKLLFEDKFYFWDLDQPPKLTGDCTKSKSNNFLFPWLEQNLKWLLLLEGAGLKMSVWIFENGDRETYPLAAQSANALSDILWKWNGISSNIDLDTCIWGTISTPNAICIYKGAQQMIFYWLRL